MVTSFATAKTLIWTADCIATANRADVLLLVRIRSGHTPFPKVYADLKDPVTDPM